MQFDFLICSERSGSNLIAKMLNAHPEVCGPFPSHVLRKFSEDYHRYGDLKKDANWQTFLQDVSDYMGSIFATWRTHLSAEEIASRVTERSLAAVARACYEREAEALGKSRLFVKENHTWSFADYLLGHFPDARFIWMVRDPRDMAATWRQMAGGGVIRATDVWRRDQRGGLRLFQFLRDIGRIHMIRFEDLVMEPEPTLRGVCECLDLEYNDAMLHFQDSDLVGENAGRIKSWTDVAGPLQPTQIGRFREELSQPEIEYIEVLCDDLMRFFGYDRDYPEADDLERVKPQLPPEDAYDRTMTPEETEAYTPWREMRKRIKTRDLDGMPEPLNFAS